ncbi:MAG TPA: hypothetical protein VG013_14535 [Gemmataceae bacterium]|jgi:hypothetical protein|nr:hypothetical protein [Gemmataceae bacterium]
MCPSSFPLTPFSQSKERPSAAVAIPPSVRYLLREDDHDDRPGVIRLDRQQEELVCEVGGWNVFVRAYPDRLEMVLVRENPGAARAA